MAVVPPMMATTVHGNRGELIDGAHATDHVDAGGDHGGSVDERADGRWTLHRIGQPDVERNLSRFSSGACEKKQSDGGENWRAVDELVLRDHAGERLQNARESGGIGETLRCEPDGAESCRDKQKAEEKSRVANAVDDEGFPTGICC